MPKRRIARHADFARAGQPARAYARELQKMYLSVQRFDDACTKMYGYMQKQPCPGAAGRIQRARAREKMQKDVVRRSFDDEDAECTNVQPFMYASRPPVVRLLSDRRSTARSTFSPAKR